MTIVEAYIKFNKQFILLVSGLSGSGKGRLSREIERDFNIKRINLDNYYKPDYKNIVVLPDKTPINDWDDPDSINWDSFNNDVNKLAPRGVIVSGVYFIKDKLDFSPDIHIHIKISKQNLLDKRHLFLENKKEDTRYKELYLIKGTSTETLVLNQLTYPHYYESIKQSNINKFFNINDKNIDELYEEVFDYIIKTIQIYLHNLKKKS
jgi:hypothetical protein